MAETHTFQTMGTMVSLDVVACSRDTLMLVIEEFERRNTQYSLYSPESELSKIARGELELPDSSPGMRECYGRAIDWRRLTDGAFTPHRPDGVIDLSGIVKAEAMQAAAQVLLAANLADWCLNAGGDVVVHGTAPDASGWSVGVVDPGDRTALLATRTLTNQRPAMATSGSAERGEHIWSSSASTNDFSQVSVVAGDIVSADVLATAIIAGGQATLDDCTRRWPIDVLAVARDGEILATPGFLTD